MIEAIGREELSKDVVSLGEVIVTKGGRFGSIEAVGVIDFALVGIREVLIGLGDFSKLLYCLITVVWVFIGMPLDSKLLIGSLDVCLSGCLAYA